MRPAVPAFLAHKHRGVATKASVKIIQFFTRANFYIDSPNKLPHVYSRLAWATHGACLPHALATGSVSTPHGLPWAPNYQEEPARPVLVGGNYVS